MAEFCADCFIKYLTLPSDNLTVDDLVLSEDEVFCEGCYKIKKSVIGVKEGRIHFD